ncbi:hypothetical protein [Vibrio phage J14]|nr:hypothetical protein [Vibrio phage J14]
MTGLFCYGGTNRNNFRHVARYPNVLQSGHAVAFHIVDNQRP